MIRPNKNYVVVEPIVEKTSGVLNPPNNKRYANKTLAKVLAVGSKVQEEQKIEVNDTIICFVENEFTVGNQSVLIVKEDSILGVLS